MSYVNPALRTQFESLPIELKNEILSRGVAIHTLCDLMSALRQIAEEQGRQGEAAR